MSHSRPRHFVRFNKALLVGLLVVGIGGCRKPAPTTEGAPSASGSAAPGAVADSCTAYSTKICDKAGAQTATCQTIKAATEFMAPEACSAGLANVDYSFKKLATLQSVCDEFTKKACAAVGAQTKTCQMVTEQTKLFPPERCKEMLARLPEVTAELQRMEEGNKPLSKEMQVAITQGTAGTFGPADAKVQIVEFSDFECPYCSKAAAVVHQIKEKYGDKVRFTFRQFPLPMHPNAKVAAEAALAAHRQGKFWEFHDALFQNQQRLDRAALEEHAKTAGLNVGAFKKSLDSKEFAAIVDSDLQLGKKVNVSGTPTLFVNGNRVADPTNFAAVTELIEGALKGSSPG
jgi:protein-disulfide isomerase